MIFKKPKPKHSYVETANVYKVLSSAVRLEIVSILSEREESFANLINILKIDKSSLSQYINTLSNANFVKVEKKGRNVYCKIANQKIPKLINTYRDIFESK